MNVKSLAIRLRTIRESRQLKQEYVAEQIGVSPATYSKIENGKVNLSAVRLQGIATALNVPVAVLLASKEESLSVEVGTIVVLQQQLVDCNRRIGALEQERTQSLDREQRLLNYIRLLEQQIG